MRTMTRRWLFLATYPLYFLVVVAVLLSLDIPSRIDPYLPRPWEAPYKLPDVFMKGEKIPNLLRRRAPYEISDVITLGTVPSIRGIVPGDYFRDPSFREETTKFEPDGRYETEYAYSMRRDLAKIFLFGDSYIISHDYKPVSYRLNEEYRIPTWRRSYGVWGSMETVYSFLAETPATALRGRYVVFDISEGGTVWGNTQLNGMPVGTIFRLARGWATYNGSVLYRRMGGRMEVPEFEMPSPLPTVRKLDSVTIVPGRTLHDDPSHLNPVLFEYLGKPRALGFYDRHLALLTWYEPFLGGGAPGLSLENWILRIGRLARARGAVPVVLYIPTHLSTYWPIVASTLDYGKMYRYIRKTEKFNRTIRSPEELRDVLPGSISSWRNLVTGACRSANVVLIDLTGPFREATLRGETVYREFDTHWNESGVEIATAEIAKIVLEGKGK